MPVNFTQNERQRLLAFLQIGRANARNASSIARHMGFPVGGNQVKTRNLIRECLERDGDLIGSTLSNPKGFFLINQANKQELETYLDSLENRARDINNRRTWLIRNWNRHVTGNRTTKTRLTY